MLCPLVHVLAGYNLTIQFCGGTSFAVPTAFDDSDQHFVLNLIHPSCIHFVVSSHIPTCVSQGATAAAAATRMHLALSARGLGPRFRVALTLRNEGEQAGVGLRAVRVCVERGGGRAWMRLSGART